MKTKQQRQALTVLFYSSMKRCNSFFHGKLMYFNTFRNQIARFSVANDFPASYEDVQCVCGENVITKAKLYHFSNN